MSGKHKFEALDGLRGVLALAVALHHFPLYSHFSMSSIVQTAGVAVDFFFVLSGFVITHASLSDLTSIRGLGIFALRRLGRLWPLHVTMLFALVALEAAKLAFMRETGIGARFAAFDPNGGHSIASIWTNVLMIHSLDIHDKWTWNAPSWSISAEFYCYLLFASIAVATPKHLTPITACVAALCGLFFAFVGPDIDVSFQYGFIRCICGFFIGHCVYRVWRASSGPLKVPSGWELGCVLLIATFPSMAQFQHFSILVPLLLAIPVWVFAHQQGVISKLLLSRPLQYLGLLSYSIYLDHQVIVDIIKRALLVIEGIMHATISSTGRSIDGVEGDFFTLGNAWIGDTVTICFLASVVGLAAVTYRFVERPGRDYFNGLARRLRTAPSKTIALRVQE